MRHICAFLFCLLVSTFAFGQDSRADLFAGYSYLNVGSNGLTTRQSFNGWEASISGNFNKWFAVETGVSGYYKNYNILGSNVAVRDYSYAAGPRINFKPLFIHALFGGDYLSAGALGQSASQFGLVGGFGGGVQWRFSRQLSFRTSADYVFSRFNISGGSSVTQNNVRASVGIVYSFGSTERARRQATPRGSGGGMLIPALGITAVAGRGQGAEITDEAPNGVAERAGLRPGDVINSVDGKPVKTPMELAAELSSRAVGDKVKLGYLLHGQWQVETVILLGASR